MTFKFIFRILLLSILLAVQHYTSAQTAAVQRDSILAINVLQHEINENGQRTVNKKILYQETYLTDGKKVRSIYYSDTNTISRYTFYFYADSLLVSADTYTGDQQIDSIRKFYYDPFGVKLSEVLYVFEKGKPKKMSTLTFIEFEGERVPEMLVNDRGKWLEQYKYTNTDYGRSESVRYRKKSREDNLLEKNQRYFMTGNRVDSVMIEKRYRKAPSVETKLIYKYDGELTEPVEIEHYDEEGVLLYTIEYRYYHGNLRNKGFKNAEGKYTEYLTFERKKHITQFGEQKMFPLETDQ